MPGLQCQAMHAGVEAFRLPLMAPSAVHQRHRLVVVRMLARHIHVAADAVICPVGGGFQFGRILTQGFTAAGLLLWQSIQWRCRRLRSLLEYVKPTIGIPGSQKHNHDQNNGHGAARNDMPPCHRCHVAFLAIAFSSFEFERWWLGGSRMRRRPGPIGQAVRGRGGVLGSAVARRRKGRRRQMPSRLSAQGRARFQGRGH